MKLFIISTCLCLLFAAAQSQEDLSTEALLHQKIDSHITGVEGQLKVLDYLLETYYKDYNYTVEDAHDYVSNPINTYMMIKRTAVEWPEVKGMIFNPKMDEEFSEIEMLAKKLAVEKGEDDKTNEVETG